VRCDQTIECDLLVLEETVRALELCIRRHRAREAPARRIDDRIEHRQQAFVQPPIAELGTLKLGSRVDLVPFSHPTFRSRASDVTGEMARDVSDH